MTPAEATLWSHWKTNACERAREALILRYEPIVPLTRQRLLPNVPRRIQVEDLESEGRLALIKSVDQFEPARMVKFATYAISRVRGAMLEHLRQEDWTPRSIRQRQRRLTTTAATLGTELGREPTEAELAGAFGMTIAELERFRDRAQPVDLISLETIMVEDDDDDVIALSAMLADPAPGPEEQVERLLWGVAIRQAVAELPPHEREAILLHFWAGLAGWQVARLCGRSDTRVHQRWSSAYRRLGEALAMECHRGPGPKHRSTWAKARSWLDERGLDFRDSLPYGTSAQLAEHCDVTLNVVSHLLHRAREEGWK